MGTKKKLSSPTSQARQDHRLKRAVLVRKAAEREGSEILHTWARTAKHAEDMPVRQISAGTGIWKDYHPEWMNL